MGNTFLSLLSTCFVLLYLIQDSSCVNHGAQCHPLIPDRHCNEGRLMTCKLQPGHINSFLCECIQGATVLSSKEGCEGSYGRSCGISDWGCNWERGLACMEKPVVGPGNCKCSDRTETEFAELTESCTRLVNANCDPAGTEPWHNICAVNSFCNGNRVPPKCECDPGYIENEGRRCVKAGGLHGDSCATDGDCDFHIHHLQCNNNVCSCASGFHTNSTGVCVRDHGGHCSIWDPCDHERYMSCSNTPYPGTCDCPRSIDAYVFYPETHNCYAGVGSRCGEDPYYNGIECIRNAECVSHPTQLDRNMCVCQDGFESSEDLGECRPI